MSNNFIKVVNIDMCKHAATATHRRNKLFNTRKKNNVIVTEFLNC